jgi:hypothetical protein
MPTHALKQIFAAAKAVNLSWQKQGRLIAPILMRWALGLTMLSAVADRFGFWGPPAQRTLVGVTGPGLLTTPQR